MCCVLIFLSINLPAANNFVKELIVKRMEHQLGNKVFLPSSALETLARYDMQFPLTFEVCTSKNKRAFVGVLQFSAPEGQIHLPQWVRLCPIVLVLNFKLLRSLNLEEGETVALKSVVLPKGEFVKFQPHSQDFLASYDYDKDKILGVLEWALPNFSALAVGDTIEIYVENKVFALNVLETRPASAVSLVSEPYLDVNLEFATPLDFVEPVKQNKEETKGISHIRALFLCYKRGDYWWKCIEVKYGR